MFFYASATNFVVKQRVKPDPLLISAFKNVLFSQNIEMLAHTVVYALKNCTVRQNPLGKCKS